MSTQGVILSKGRVGVNTLGSPETTSGLIAGGVAVAGKIALGEVVTLYQPADAEAYGIDANYDTANNVQVYRHISEFYRRAGRGKKLFLMLVAQAVSMTEIVEDVTGQYAKKLIAEAGGEIFQLSVAKNPAAGYVSVILDGLDSDVVNAIPKAQALAGWALETFRPLVVLLEGREYTGLAAAALNLRAIPNVQAENVAVIIGQDWDYADGLSVMGQKMADVGTALGTLAVMRVNQNIGEVETQNLTDATRGSWLTPGLSGHQKARALEAEWDTLDGKGYIFGIQYTGADGVRWNDDHTCTPVIIDVEGNMNRHSLSLSRTDCKVFREVRKAMLPKVKTVQPLDPTSGKLPVAIIKYFEGIGDTPLERMAERGEISAGKTYVDPESDLLTPPKELKADYNWVPYGTVGVIRGNINIVKSLN